MIELSARTEIDKSTDLVTLSVAAHHQVELPRRERGGGGEVSRYAARRGDEADLAGVGAGAAGQSRDRAGALAEGAAGQERPAADPVPHRPVHAGAGRRRAARCARRRASPRLSRVINTTALILQEPTLEDALPVGARPLVGVEGGRRRLAGRRFRAADAGAGARGDGEGVRSARGQERRRQAGVRAGRRAAADRRHPADRAPAVERRAAARADSRHAAPLHDELAERHLPAARRADLLRADLRAAGSPRRRSPGRGASWRASRCPRSSPRSRRSTRWPTC